MLNGGNQLYISIRKGKGQGKVQIRRVGYLCGLFGKHQLQKHSKAAINKGILFFYNECVQNIYFLHKPTKSTIVGFTRKLTEGQPSAINIE